MGFGRSRGDAPRVVGFDFGPPAAAPVPPAPPVAGQVAEPVVQPVAEFPPPPPAYVPPMEPAYASAPAAPAYPPPYAEPAAAPSYPPSYTQPAAPVFAATPGYGTPPGGAAPYAQPDYAAEPAYQPYVPPAQYQPWTPPPLPAPAPVVKQRSGISRELSILGALVAVIVVIGGVQRFTGGDKSAADTGANPAPVASFSLPPAIEDINAPASVGGEQRLNTRFGRALARGLREQLPNGGRHAEIELYGFDQPQYAIIAGDLMKGDNAAWYRYMAKPSPRSRIGGARAYAGGLLCGTYNASTFRGSLCVWTTKYYKAVLVGYTQQSPARLATVATKARKDLERGR